MATRIVQANKARLPAENQPPPPNPLSFSLWSESPIFQ
jgi:hypothetical protein